MVVEEAGHDLLQPSPLFGDGPMHAASQFVLHFLQLRPHAVPPGGPFDRELAGAGFTADEGEAEEVERLRLAEPAPVAVRCRKAAELDPAGLLRMKRQRKRLEPRGTATARPDTRSLRACPGEGRGSDAFLPDVMWSSTPAERSPLA